MPHEQGRDGRLGPRLVIGIVLLVWLVAAWHIAGFITERRAHESLATGQRRLQQNLSELSAGVANQLKLIHAIPATVGRYQEIAQGLKRFVITTQTPAPPAAKRQGVWTADPGLRRIDRLLEQATADLGIVDPMSRTVFPRI
jgi:C4-dicarboxylate-specific signal transduction histidine kinase